MPDRKRPVRLVSLVCLLLFAGFAAAPAAARELRVGIYQNAPKLFVDESGQPAGIFVDILEQIARQEDWQLNWIPGSWGEGLNRLEQGTLDLMPDVAYSAEREAIFSFHQEPVLSDWFQVYALRNSGIRSIVDLDNQRIAVLESSVQQRAFLQLAEGFGLRTRVLVLPDYQALFATVAAGQADAAVTNRFFGAMHAEQFGLEDTAVIFHPTQLFYAAPRASGTELLAAIDRRLLQFKQDRNSVYYQSLQGWTDEQVAFSLPGWVGYAALGGGLLLLMSLVGGTLLNRQVNARTRELRELNRDMEQRIDERTAELAAAMEKALDADRLKSAFLATMSHELRTPLNSIIGFTGILLQQLPGPLNTEQHKQLGMVQSSARHLLALINDVLDISRIEAGQLELSIQPFELRESIEKVFALITPLADKKGLQLLQEIAPEVTTVTSDKRRIEQIVLNLLSNALKFTERGQVRLACWLDQDDYLLEVADSGIGIQEDDLEQIFQPFLQLDSGLTRKRDGTGLGLSISRKLLELLGGTISVTSRWQQGSCFRIRFPRVLEGQS